MAAVARGPITIDDSAVPFGWELEPVTGTGMCQTDITKTAAPMRASMDMYAGFAFRVWAIFLAPIATKNMATRYHAMLH